MTDFSSARGAIKDTANRDSNSRLDDTPAWMSDYVDVLNALAENGPVVTNCHKCKTRIHIGLEDQQPNGLDVDCPGCFFRDVIRAREAPVVFRGVLE